MTRIVVGAALVIAGIGGLGWWGMRSPGAVSYYVTSSEAVAKQPGTPLRLGGRVASGSLQRTGARVAFDVTDGRTRVPVSYAGEVPDTLKEGTDVIAEGAMQGGTLRANRVLAKCSSRFVSRTEADARRAAGEGAERRAGG